jgi:hypothetical protein
MQSRQAGAANRHEVTKHMQRLTDDTALHCPVVAKREVTRTTNETRSLRPVHRVLVDRLDVPLNSIDLLIPREIADINKEEHDRLMQSCLHDAP